MTDRDDTVNLPTAFLSAHAHVRGHGGDLNAEILDRLAGRTPVPFSVAADLIVRTTDGHVWEVSQAIAVREDYAWAPVLEATGKHWTCAPCKQDVDDASASRHECPFFPYALRVPGVFTSAQGLVVWSPLGA